MKKKKFLKKIHQSIQSDKIAQLLEKKKKFMFPLWSQKDNDNNTIIESGRSIVEMLGVLAVIGVLSVGRIAGYTYAVNKYRANQVLNEVNLTSHLFVRTLLSKIRYYLSIIFRRGVCMEERGTV